MTSVGRKLTLNFSKGRLTKKKTDRIQDDCDVSDRRGSWASGLGPHKSSSMTNLHVENGDGILDQTDIMQLTQFVRNFSEALYKLKEVFNFQNKPDVNGDNVRIQAHDKLGELLCQLSALKKYQATLTSDVLMAAQNVINVIKKSSYTDLNTESVEILDVVDRLDVAFSTSISEYLMGDMDSTARIIKSRSCENLLAENQDQSFLDPTEKTQPGMNSADIDLTLLRVDKGVDIALNRAKLWSKYAKDITTYIEKRATLEAEYSRSLAKLANGVHETITEDSFLPFQSIYVMALNHDINAGSKSQATWQIIQTQKFIEPLNTQRTDHEKTRKYCKDTWAKEQKKMHDAESNLKKSQNLYVTRHLEYDKAREVTQKQKAEAENLSQSSGLTKMEKKRKQEEEAMHKAMEAETTYKSCVVEANNRQQELEKVKANILASIRELIFESDKVMKSVTMGYFQLMQAASAPVPAQFQELCEISDRYSPGFQYTEFVKGMALPAQPCVPEPFIFEPYDRDPSSYDLRKPSTQSSGSGSDILAYGDESPASNHLKVKHQHRDGDGEYDTVSESSSKSTSPTSSPYPQHRNFSEADGSSVSSNTTFAGMLLSAPARTHVLRKLRAPTRCRQCDSYVYFNGAECEKCGIATHKKCLETLNYQCGGSTGQAPQPKGMTTFGVDFVTHVKQTKTDVPYIMRKCTEAIEETGIDIKGIYRVSGVKSKVEALCQNFETEQQNVDLSEQNPHVISNVLKLYLRQLPEPLLTFKLYPLLIQLAREEQSQSLKLEEVLSRLKELLDTLPRQIRRSLALLMRHLAKVKDTESENQMSATNLGIVFGPTLLRPSDEAASLDSLIETPHQQRIVILLILHTDTLLPDDCEVEKSTTDTHSSTSTDRSSRPLSTDKWPVPEIQESLLDELVRAEPLFQQARIPPANNAPVVADSAINLPGSMDTVNHTAQQPQQEEDPSAIESNTISATTTASTTDNCFDEEDLTENNLLPDHTNIEYVRSDNPLLRTWPLAAANRNLQENDSLTQNLDDKDPFLQISNDQHSSNTPHNLSMFVNDNREAPCLTNKNETESSKKETNFENETSFNNESERTNKNKTEPLLRHCKNETGKMEVSNFDPSGFDKTTINTELTNNKPVPIIVTTSASPDNTKTYHNISNPVKTRQPIIIIDAPPALRSNASMQPAVSVTSSTTDACYGLGKHVVVDSRRRASDIGPHACSILASSNQQPTEKADTLPQKPTGNLQQPQQQQQSKKILPSQVLRTTSKFYTPLPLALSSTSGLSQSSERIPQLTKPRSYSPNLSRRTESFNVSGQSQKNNKKETIDVDSVGYLSLSNSTFYQLASSPNSSGKMECLKFESQNDRKNLSTDSSSKDNHSSLSNSTFYAALDLSPTRVVPNSSNVPSAGLSAYRLSAAEMKLLKMSPAVSPAVSPTNSPKCSPKGSPLPNRHSPLTLSNDRTPRYV